MAEANLDRMTWTLWRYEETGRISWMREMMRKGSRLEGMCRKKAEMKQYQTIWAWLMNLIE